MPTPIKTADKMSPGGRAGGKHWTNLEIEARDQADEQSRRKRRVTLKPPAWLIENDDALLVWKDMVKKLRGIELLDNLDTEMLAIYCDAIVQYRNCSKRMSGTNSDGAPIDDLIKAMQAWARIVTTYADKLGLTPGGRARLAKKKADKVIDNFADAFGG